MHALRLRPCLALFSVILFSLLLASCGGGGGGGGGSASVAPAGTGGVALLLTDGPASDFDEINIDVIRAELFCDSGRYTLFRDSNGKTFNLLELEDDGRIFAIREGIPAGRCNKIRLTLTGIELVKKDDNGNITEKAYPKLPGNGKLDLVPRGDFLVTSGRTILVQIDMDAGKSIHIVGTGSGKYQFRPVVFVDIISNLFPGKLVRAHGVIDDIDNDDGEFELCNLEISLLRDDSTLQRHGCIEVSVVNATSIFDEDGLPARFRDLKEGEEATVYGRLEREDDDHDDDDNSRELDDLELVASVIELGPEGTFLTLKGTGRSSVDSGNDEFLMEIAPNQGFGSGTVVSVLIQDGTKIVNRRGKVLGPDDIDSGVAMRVDGVLDTTTDPDTLRAALIVLDMDAARQERISGTIGSNPDGSCGLTLMTDTGDISVKTRNANAFLVTATDGNGSSEPIPVNDLVSGQTADMYGESDPSDGCFDAETIIAYELD